MSVALHDIVAHLDAFLNVDGIPDYPGAFNGLQVENGGAVTKVAVAVDACQATIDGAAAIGADLLLVHHGLFWGRTLSSPNVLVSRTRWASACTRGIPSESPVIWLFPGRNWSPA